MNNPDLYKAHINLPVALETPGGWRPLFNEMEKASKDNFEICVKKQNNFSKWLHESDLKSDEFVIRGPFVIYA